MLLVLVLVAAALSKERGSRAPPTQSPPSGLRVLTADNFYDEVDKFDNVLVVFYDGSFNCHPCDTARATAAVLMEERDEVRAEKEEGTYNPSSMKYAGDVEFAEIDCAQHRTRCNDFEVGRVPQVSLFSEGLAVYDYPSQSITYAQFLDFIEKFSAPKFTKISIDEFEDAVEEQELSLVMAYVADDDDEEPKVLGSFRRASAHLFEYIRVLVVELPRGDDKFTRLTGSPPLRPVIVRRPSKWEDSTDWEVIPDTEEQLTRKKIEDWVTRSIPATVAETVEEKRIQRKLFPNRPLIIFFFTESTVDEVYSIAYAMNKIFSDKMLITLERSADVPTISMRRTGVRSIPSVMARSGKLSYVPDEPFNKVSVQKFLRKIADKTAESYVIEEPVPEDPMENGVTKLVAKTYREVVTDASKDVVVYFSMPTELCAPCGDFIKQFEAAAQQFAHHPEIVFSKIDLFLNDDQPSPRTIQNFPTIRIYTTEDKYGTNQYDGPRSVEGIVTWVLDQASYEFKPQKPDAAASAEEPAESIASADVE